MLNDDMYVYLLRFLDKHTLKNFKLILRHLRPQIYQEEKRRFALSFNFYLKEIIGIQNLIKSPILKFKKSYISHNFIDKISIKDLNENKLMIGKDNLGRNFIVLNNIENFSMFVIYDRKKNSKKLSGFFTYYNKKDWVNEYYIPDKEYSKMFLEKVKTFWLQINDQLPQYLI